MKRDYSSDVEGGAPVCVRYEIAGHFDRERYLSFLAERAAWLDISGWAMSDGDAVVMVAAGPEALVGALEMASTLGPDDALVERIAAVAFNQPVPAGFAIRQK